MADKAFIVRDDYTGEYIEELVTILDAEAKPKLNRVCWQGWWWWW